MGVQSLGQEDPLEEEMATLFSIAAWEIPWTEEPGGLQGEYPLALSVSQEDHSAPAAAAAAKLLQ